MKEDISPQKFATVILGSLPESYDNFITSLNAKDAKELEWENIKGLLIEEFMKRKEKSKQNSTNDALFTKKGQFSSAKGKPHGSHYGYTRSREPQKSRDDYFDRDKNNGPKCFKCRKYAGHLAKDCPLNKKNRQSNMIAVSKDPEACGEDTAVESQFEEMALTSSEKHQLNNGWFIDSGASKHMTYDRKNIISDFIEFKTPSRIFLGDNRIIHAIAHR